MISATSSPRPFADERGGDVQHLAHARAAGRALVADHDHVARLDRPGLDRGEALLLGVEDARRAAVVEPLVAGELDDGALGRERAAQDREPAGRLERLAATRRRRPGRASSTSAPTSAERAAVDAARVAVGDAGADELARDEADAAGLVHVGGDVAAARLQVGDDRGALGDLVEVLELERDPDLAGDREQVQDAVRRAAGAGDGGDRVLERVAREDLGRANVVADERHHELAGLAGRLGLRRVRRRDAREPARADAEEVDHERHRVGRELAAAGAGAGAGDRSRARAPPRRSSGRPRARRRPRRRPGSSRRGRWKRPGAIEPL